MNNEAMERDVRERKQTGSIGFSFLDTRAVASNTSKYCPRVLIHRSIDQTCTYVDAIDKVYSLREQADLSLQDAMASTKYAC